MAQDERRRQGEGGTGTLLGLLALVLTFLSLGWGWTAAPALAALPPGNAVTDPSALLRDALPVDQPQLKELQHRLENTSNDLRAKRWGALANTVRRTQSLATGQRAGILASFPEANRPEAEALFDQLDQQLQSLADASEAENREGFLNARRQALGAIGSTESLLVGPFPFTIPEAFTDLPRLLGRATVRLTTTKGDLTAVVDGYSAPLTAGAFVDLVQRGFYDGLPFNRAEDFYVLQTGDPAGPADGFIDPVSKQQRRVPLEIKVPGEASPFYNQTFEELGLFKANPTLPFATKGTLGWAHSDAALDDGSSQFFLFLFEAELTPAGLNLIDGRYAAFGYVVDGFDVLAELTADDGIVSAKVLEGADNLRAHG
ncbi:MAG: peptidylprolyl isomerase [Synechococcaceae cyanobacterium ELA445]